MRRLPFVGFLALVLLASFPAAGPAHAQDAAATAEDAGTPPDPGVVEPDPVDPTLSKLNRAQCKRLARQILQYTDVAARASDRGDDLWEQTTVAHVDRLEERWNTGCASPDQTWAIFLNQMMSTAARLALKYFTMGYFD
jgi:hypothetical protein